MPQQEERLAEIAPFYIKKYSASSRWAVYADSRGLDDRVENEEFGDEAAELYGRTYAGRDEAYEAAVKIADIVKPSISSPFSVKEYHEGGFVVVMSYKGYKAFCGHINANQAGKVAKKVYRCYSDADEAARKVNALLFGDDDKEVDDGRS